MRPFNVVLKALREEMMLTQRELAEAAGLSYETIRSFEYGRRKPTKIVQLRQLMAGLGLDPLSPEADELAMSGAFGATGHTLNPARMLNRLGAGKLD